MPRHALKLASDTTRKPPRSFVFTVAQLANVKPRPGKQTWVYDDKQPGLAILTTSSGHKAFYLYKKVNGRPVRLKLGDIDAITIEQARKRAADLVKNITLGRDPADERRQKRGELTLDELHGLYHEHHAKLRSTPKTLVAEASLWKALASIKTRRLSAITPNVAATLHAQLGRDRGKSTANRITQYLGRLIAYAAKRHGYEGKNPVIGVDMFPEASRERFLSADELPGFLAAVEQEEPPFPDLFKLLLLTGARRGNVQAMKWADIDLAEKRWTIPAAESKNRKPMPLPLVDGAVAILSRRYAEAQAAASDDEPMSDYVFPVIRNKGKRGHIGQPTQAWRRILQRADISDLRIHDLRRTMGAWQAIGGASLLVIGRSLGHRDQRATAIYARLSDDPVRVSMEQAAQAMLGGANPPSSQTPPATPLGDRPSV